MLTGHGDDQYRYPYAVEYDFSTNVRNADPPEGLKEHLFNHWQSITHYPEPSGESLQRKIAEYYNLSSNQVLPVNGTTEAIYLLAFLYSGVNTAIATPTFAEYEDACHLNRHAIRYLNIEMLTQKTENLKGINLVFLCNPNNPTGDRLSRDQVRQLLEEHPETLFVLDEAYIHFTDTDCTALPLLEEHHNLIILRSLTKTYAIPGLRIGYLISTANQVQRLTTVKPPWTVNKMALEAGHYLFDHPEIPLPPIQNLRETTEHLRQEIDALNNFETISTQTHFFLVRIKDGTAEELKQFLLEKYGILIRNAANFRGLTPQHFRISALEPEANEKLVDALKVWKL